MRALLTVFDSEGDFCSVFQVLKVQAVEGVAMEVNLVPPFLEYEAVPLLREELRDHTAERNWRDSNLFRSALLAEFVDLRLFLRFTVRWLTFHHVAYIPEV